MNISIMFSRYLNEHWCEHLGKVTIVFPHFHLMHLRSNHPKLPVNNKLSSFRSSEIPKLTLLPAPYSTPSWPGADLSPSVEMGSPHSSSPPTLNICIRYVHCTYIMTNSYFNNSDFPTSSPLFSAEWRGLAEWREAWTRQWWPWWWPTRVILTSQHIATILTRVITRGVYLGRWSAQNH